MSYHLYLKELTNYDYLALVSFFKTEPLKTRSPCSDVSNDHLYSTLYKTHTKLLGSTPRNLRECSS